MESVAQLHPVFTETRKTVRPTDSQAPHAHDKKSSLALPLLLVSVADNQAVRDKCPRSLTWDGNRVAMKWCKCDSNLFCPEICAAALLTRREME
jgi:hypothetical protein